MHFDTKNYLKSNRNHTDKYILKNIVCITILTLYNRKSGTTSLGISL